MKKIHSKIETELKRARSKFPPFHSSHEGMGVIQEEIFEMWEAIRKNNIKAAKREAVQVAAMAVRFIEDL